MWRGSNALQCAQNDAVGRRLELRTLSERVRLMIQGGMRLVPARATSGSKGWTPIVASHLAPLPRLPALPVELTASQLDD
jgi:hypothetical protein